MGRYRKTDRRRVAVRKPRRTWYWPTAWWPHGWTRTEHRILAERMARDGDAPAALST